MKGSTGAHGQHLYTQVGPALQALSRGFGEERSGIGRLKIRRTGADGQQGEPLSLHWTGGRRDHVDTT